MASRLQIKGDDSVLLRVTHSDLKSFATDVRFSLQISVEAVKEKLWKRCGTKLSDDYMEVLCANIKVGDRCEVEPGEKRGVVKYAGRAEALEQGFWIGVQYDEPLGKHDGMVKGMRYFQCPLLCGAMARPNKLKMYMNHLLQDLPMHINLDE
ncbi:hypothetical protein CRYUN_Cryun16bG0069100 [Craigia yunnanensis]